MAYKETDITILGWDTGWDWVAWNDQPFARSKKLKTKIF